MKRVSIKIPESGLFNLETKTSIPKKTVITLISIKDGEITVYSTPRIERKLMGWKGTNQNDSCNQNQERSHYSSTLETNWRSWTKWIGTSTTMDTW